MSATLLGLMLAVVGSSPNNVSGGPLQACSTQPMTGFFRDGRCVTGPQDHGTHVVCAEISQAFLDFTKGRGNDLTTPAPRYRFPGLQPGDRWCLCALRWKEALDAQVAPLVVLEATEQTALRFITKDVLREHAASVRRDKARGSATKPPAP